MAMERSAGGEDRVSALPDGTLTRILSHLHTDEAVRTSALSRRWRRVFTTVPVVNLSARDCFKDNKDQEPFSVGHMVNCALLNRDCTAPIRSFRVIDLGDQPSHTLIDQWIATALFAGAEKVDLDLPPRFPEMPICPHTVIRSPQPLDVSMLKELSCTMPRHLFSSNTLRHLRLGNCKLALPEQTLSLGSLETLSLRRINAPGEGLQRLIAACPRLAELTLEECPTVKHISVVLLHLRTFTVRCCHNATRVFVAAPSLRCLRFKGTVPGCSALSMTDWEGVALAVDICGAVDGEDSDTIRRLGRFLEGCTNLTMLRLSAQQKPPFFLWYRAPLPSLTHLELSGPFRNRGHIAALAKILDNTANLEVLTLVIDRRQVYEVSTCRVIKVPKVVRWSSTAECFRRTLRKIHLVKYSGNATQRRLAKFLLTMAVRMEELHVTFAGSAGEGPETDRLKQEMEGWKRNPRTRIIYVHERK